MIVIPAPYVYHGEAGGRPVVYADDVASIVAGHLAAMAAHYPENVFPPDSQAPDAIAGTALRTVLTSEAGRLRREMTWDYS